MDSDTMWFETEAELNDFLEDTSIIMIHIEQEDNGYVLIYRHDDKED
jgi:hypothetical protein